MVIWLYYKPTVIA